MGLKRGVIRFGDISLVIIASKTISHKLLSVLVLKILGMALASCPWNPGSKLGHDMVNAVIGAWGKSRRVHWVGHLTKCQYTARQLQTLWGGDGEKVHRTSLQAGAQLITKPVETKFRISHRPHYDQILGEVICRNDLVVELSLRAATISTEISTDHVLPVVPPRSAKKVKELFEGMKYPDGTSMFTVKQDRQKISAPRQRPNREEDHQLPERPYLWQEFGVLAEDLELDELLEERYDMVTEGGSAVEGLAGVGKSFLIRKYCPSVSGDLGRPSYAWGRPTPRPGS